jgi:hypothetical protein
MGRIDEEKASGVGTTATTGAAVASRVGAAAAEGGASVQARPGTARHATARPGRTKAEAIVSPRPRLVPENGPFVTRAILSSGIAARVPVFEFFVRILEPIALGMFP